MNPRIPLSGWLVGLVGRPVIVFYKCAGKLHFQALVGTVYSPKVFSGVQLPYEH